MLDRCCGTARRPRSSATSSRAWSATGSTATSLRATGRTSGRPSATSRRPSTSSRAPSQTEVAARMGATFVCVEDGVASTAAGSSPPRWSRAAADRRRARGSVAARCSSTASSVGEGTTIESAVVMRGRVDRRALHAARLHRRGGRADRRSLRDRRDERDRRGRGARRRQRRLQRRAAVPRRVAARRGAAVLMRLDRARRSPPSTAPASSTRCSASPSTCATRSGASTRPARGRSTPRGGVIVAGMGGSAAGARLAIAALGRGCAAAGRLRRLRAARLGGPVDAGLRLQLLRQHRGDARGLRRRGRAWRAAARRDDRRRAGRARAARRRARDPDPRRLPAAGGDRLRARRRAGGGRAGRRGAVGARRDRGRGRAGRQLAAEWGPDGAEDNEAKTLARALHGTVPVIAGAELAAAAAYRWKCQFNENAALPAFASRAAGGRPQRGRRLGRGAVARLASPTCRWRTRGRTRATRCGRS